MEFVLTAEGDRSTMTVDELIGQVGDASCRFVGYMRRLFEVFEAELDANDIRNFRRRP